MLQTYIKYLYPGSFFPEERIEKVSDRKIVDLPEGAFCYQFFDREETEIEGETLYGKDKNHSGRFYKGDIFTLDELKVKFPFEFTLISNMESNKWDYLIRTVRGNWQPFEKRDALL